MKALRGRLQGGYLERLRFDKAIGALRTAGGYEDMLKGGQLSYPGGQVAFDKRMAELRGL